MLFRSRPKGKLTVRVEYTTAINFSLQIAIPELKITQPIALNENASLDLAPGRYTVVLKGLMGDPSYRGDYSAFSTAYGSFERRQPVEVRAGEETVCVLELPRPALPVTVHVLAHGNPVFGAEVLIREADANFRVTRPPEGARFDLEEGCYPVVVNYRGQLLKDVIQVHEGQTRFVVDLSRQVVLGPAKVVVRYLDGRMVKGKTEDFTPGKDEFTVVSPYGDRTVVGGTEGMKAVLFVKLLEGNRSYKAQQDFAIASQFGRRTIVQFKDGEEMRGYVLPGHTDEENFFLFPVDPKSNNAKVYVIREAVSFLGTA
jgi:hypothetical protein